MSRSSPQSIHRTATASEGRRRTLGVGRPLDPGVRLEMEARFGESFSDVRIHDGVEAQRSSALLGAKAYTVGNDIAFNSGHYAPASPEGRRLVAHELAHVVQQTRHPGSGPATAAHEADADGAAHAAMAGGQAAVSLGSGPAVQCEPLDAARISTLTLEEVDARLMGNQREAAPVILTDEYRSRLEEESSLLQERRAQLTTSPAPQQAEGGTSSPDPADTPTADTGDDPDSEDRARLQRETWRPATPAEASSMAVHGIDHYSGGHVPYTDGTGPMDQEPFRLQHIGPYLLGPNSIQCRNGEYALLYYIAYHREQQQNHWIVGPGDLGEFRRRVDEEGDLFVYNGGLRPYEIESQRFVWGSVNSLLFGEGDLGESFSHLGTSWGQAVQDPHWLLQAAAATLPVERIVGPAMQWGMRRAAPTVLAASMRGVAETAPVFTMRNVATSAIEAPLANATTRSVAPIIAADVAPALAPTLTSETTQLATSAAERNLASSLPATVANASRLAAPSIVGAATSGLSSTATTPTVSSAVPRDALRGITQAEIDQALDGAFQESSGPAADAIARRPGRVPRSADATQARADFGQVRPGYAQALRVAAYGQVHHAIEVQVLSRYPGVYTQGEINDLANMRGIPPEIGGRTQLHNSKIREILDRHYAALDDEIARRGLTPGTPEYNQLVRQWMASARSEIDWALGQFFSEQRASLPTAY